MSEFKKRIKKLLDNGTNPLGLLPSGLLVVNVELLQEKLYEIIDEAEKDYAKTKGEKMSYKNRNKLTEVYDRAKSNLNPIEMLHFLGFCYNTLKNDAGNHSVKQIRTELDNLTKKE